MEETGFQVEETPQSLKAQMVRQLRLLGEATAGVWEQAVFGLLTGHSRVDLDWSHQPNRTGYRLWIATFSQLVGELVVQGAVRREVRNGRSFLSAAPAEASN